MIDELDSKDPGGEDELMDLINSGILMLLLIAFFIAIYLEYC